jgi:hypothetical protein
MKRFYAIMCIICLVGLIIYTIKCETIHDLAFVVMWATALIINNNSLQNQNQ